MLWAFQKKHRNLVSDFNRKNITDASTKSKSFFTREDVSRVTTDRKQTITRNIHVDTTRNLHKNVFRKHCKDVIFFIFCLSPFWVVHPSMSDRETCMCKLSLPFCIQPRYSDRQQTLDFLPSRPHTLKWFCMLVVTKNRPPARYPHRRTKVQQL